MSGRSFALALALALGASSGARADDGARPPAAVVETLDAALLDSMRHAAERGARERAEQLLPIVAETYDLPFMARAAVGGAWQKLDAAQRERWVAALGRLISATLADGFDSYANEKFVSLGEEPASLETRIVKTRLVTPGESDVQFDYRLRKGPSGYRVIDVYVDGGISEVALRRSEYSALLREQGFPALLAQVERKTEALTVPRR